MCKQIIFFLSSLLIFSVGLAFYSCAGVKNNHDALSEEEILRQAKQKTNAIVMEAVSSVIDKKEIDKLSTYFSTEYLEHHDQTTINYKQFFEFVNSTSDIIHRRSIYRKVVERSTVAFHSRLEYADFVFETIDFFEVDNDKIVTRIVISKEIPNVDPSSAVVAESSSASSPAPSPSDSASASTKPSAASTEPTSSASSSEALYKTAIERLYNTIYLNAKTDDISALFSNDFIQHNPQLPPGKQGMIDWISLGPMEHSIQLIVAENDLVFVLAENEKHKAVYADIFRFSKEGLILESWSIHIIF